MRFAWFAFLLVLPAPLTGCPDSEKCVDHNPTIEAGEPVSLERNIMPIFKASCTFSTCHGSTSTPNGVYLGSTVRDNVHKAIVDVRSSRLPTMSYITPNDPRNSFLMRKMDHSACILDSQCTDAECGDGMPQGEDKLDEATRDTVRRWILQGAPNN